MGREVCAAVCLVFVWGTLVAADVRVVSECRRGDEATQEFPFSDVARPALNDAAADATFTLVAGREDSNGGGLTKLHDGYLPGHDDDPGQSFFFAAGTPGGRISIDLHRTIDVGQVNTYSWHRSSRGPQVYQLYGSNGETSGFDAQPPQDLDPATSGWTRIATVDLRPAEGEPGGQYGVSIASTDGSLGQFRYLLFVVERTEEADAFGNTFLSEIDVIDRHAPPVTPAPTTRPGHVRVAIGEGRYQIDVDASATPDLIPWVETELMPVIEQWYPRIVDLLPSDGFEAPRTVSITFRPDMQGVAATGGTHVQCAAAWFREQLQGEAKGAVVHELVHVVQQYNQRRRGNRGAGRPPGWLVEGIADYVRWFLYEPESKGAEIGRHAASRARFDASYRVSANFLNWVTQQYDRQLVPKLNAAIREGRYSEQLWKELTGHTVQELGDQWKANLQREPEPAPPEDPQRAR